MKQIKGVHLEQTKNINFFEYRLFKYGFSKKKVIEDIEKILKTKIDQYYIIGSFQNEVVSPFYRLERGEVTDCATQIL